MPKPNSDCRATERKHPWPMVRLGDVCDYVHRGKSPVYCEASSYPMFAQKCNQPFGIVLDKCKFCEPKVYNRFREEYRLRDNDIVVNSTGTGTLGRVGLFHTEYLKPYGYESITADSHVMIVRTNPSTIPAYLYWYMKQDLVYDWINDNANGSTNQKELYPQTLSQLEIPLPPLSIQREIVARLERELATVEKIKKDFEALAETAKAEFKAELKEVFEEISRGGAETRRLGEVCELKAGGDKPKNFSKIKTQTHKFPVVSNGIGGDGICGFSNVATIVEPCVTVSARGTIGWACVRDYPFVPIVRLIVATPCAIIDVRYLLYVFKRLPIEYAGSSIPQLTVPMIKDMELPLPPLAVQREVVARLDSAKARAEKLEAKAREGVAVCETMRKAILKEAFE